MIYILHRLEGKFDTTVILIGINYMFNHAIDYNRHCTVNDVILQLPPVKRY